MPHQEFTWCKNRKGNSMKWIKYILMVLALLAMLALPAAAQTEANAIITSVDSAFDLLVPVTIAIVTFFVVIRLAKRVVK